MGWTEEIELTAFTFCSGMDKYLEYSFTEGGDSAMDSKDFIGAHFLAQLPKLLKSAVEYADYRGVLVLAKSMQEFS